MKSRVASTSAASRERLEKISHHFLTAKQPQSRQEVAQPLVIPVISASPEAQFPHNHLVRALAARGRSARVLDIPRGVQNSVNPTEPPDPSRQPGAALSDSGEGGSAPLTPDRIREQVADLDPGLCLVPLDAGDVAVAVELGSLLICVTPDRDGLLAGYRLAKAAWTRRPGASVGVTVLNARDRASAALHFQKLAEGVTRFLGEELISFGYIPAPPDPYAAVDLLNGHGPEAEVERAVEGIANLILADLEALESETDEAPAPADENTKTPVRALRAAGGS